MFLIQEMKEKGLQVICTQPYIYCKVFEDNSGSLELAQLHKLRPCTKHINVCYHHFCKHVQNGLIKIFPVGTKDQTADDMVSSCVVHKVPKILIYIRGNQYKKIVPVPAVPEPNSPDGVIPKYPSRGDFLAGSNLY
jgi:hypothetical protein